MVLVICVYVSHLQDARDSDREAVQIEIADINEKINAESEKARAEKADAAVLQEEKDAKSTMAATLVQSVVG